MSRAILVLDMPESCLKCPMLNGNDDCILQSEDDNFMRDTFEELKENCPLRELHERKEDRGIERSIKVIKEVAGEYNNGWIPCSERLPKYDEEYFEKHNNHKQYIVMCKDAYEPTVAYFSKGKTWYYNDFVKFNDVIAWQPIPEPYKESDNE